MGGSRDVWAPTPGEAFGSAQRARRWAACREQRKQAGKQFSGHGVGSAQLEQARSAPSAEGRRGRPHGKSQVGQARRRHRDGCKLLKRAFHGNADTRRPTGRAGRHAGSRSHGC